MGFPEDTGFNASDREPMPETTSNSHAVLPLVLQDLKDRVAAGTKKYGQELHTHNGRKALVDLYQELLDACLYARQLIEERKDKEMVWSSLKND